MESKRAVAPLAATAAIHLGRWDSIEKYTTAIDERSCFEGSFFRAIVAVHKGQFGEAMRLVEK
jgi:hypothetical protein